MKQKSVEFRAGAWGRRLLAGVFAGSAWLAGSTAAQAQAVRAGEMSFELASGSQLSYLGIDVVALEASLCGALPAPSTKDPKLVIANDGGHTGRVFGLDVQLATESGGGTQIAVEVEAGALSLTGPHPLPTSCGSWSYRLSLDPGAPSPVSTLNLMRNRASDQGGAFVGSVGLAATLELTPLSGGAVQLRTYNLQLDLSGTWGLSRTSGVGDSGVSGNLSNLILFTQKSGSSWVKTAQAAPAHSLEDPNPGQLVLQPTDEALAELNAPRPR